MAGEEAKSTETATQARVLSCIVAAISVAVPLSAVAYQMIPVSRLTSAPLDTAASRLIFTLQWNALSVAVIYAMVLFIGGLRHKIPHQQNPCSTDDREKVEVHVRVLQNTVEQFVMSVMAQLALSTWLGAAQMTLIPIVVTLFVVGRIIFWVGYLNPAHNRTNRVFGLPLTLLPTMIMVVFNVYKLVVSTF